MAGTMEGIRARIAAYAAQVREAFEELETFDAAAEHPIRSGIREWRRELEAALQQGLEAKWGSLMREAAGSTTRTSQPQWEELERACFAKAYAERVAQPLLAHFDERIAAARE
jgi:hypothetical protein